MIVQHLISKHSVPHAITSDWGSQFTKETWEQVCALLGIKQWLSTAYHPETNGSTEWMNSVVETYLHMYTAYGQKDWNWLLPMAELVLNCRTAASTEVSPFFLSHGYNPSSFTPIEDPETLAEEPTCSSIQKGEAIVQTITEVLNWAQAVMAHSQQEMEWQANQQQEPTPEYQIDDHVWLNLKNVCTEQSCKKLDWRNTKFSVVEVIGTHTIWLNTSPGIHLIFHVDLLWPAAKDSLPSQHSDDSQPPGIIVDDQEEFQVEKIMNEHCTRWGQGWRLQYEVKWVGYAQTTWELASALEDTVALDEWLSCTRTYHHADGSLDNLQMK